MRLRVLTCEILRSEITQARRGSQHDLSIEYIDLDRCHEKVKQGHVEIQQAIDGETGAGWDAILLGWGLCGRMLNGITARDIRLVIPRTHDCLAILLGSRRRYVDYFLSHPGTYYLSNGWLSHATADGGDLTGQMQLGEVNYEYQQLVDRYGEDNAAYLAQVMGTWESHYSTMCLVLQDHDDAEGLRRKSQNLCRPRGWELTTLDGDLGLLERWLNGEWSPEEFLIVPPGHQVVESYDEAILGAEPQHPHHT